MNLDAQISQLARAAVEPMLAERLDHLERLIEGLAARVSDDVVPPIMKTKDVAAYLKVSLRTVERLIARGGFPSPIRLGGNSVRWRRSDVDGWLEGRRSAP